MVVLDWFQSIVECFRVSAGCQVSLRGVSWRFRGFTDILGNFLGSFSGVFEGFQSDSGGFREWFLEVSGSSQGSFIHMALMYTHLYQAFA